MEQQSNEILCKRHMLTDAPAVFGTLHQVWEVNE